MNDFIWAHDSTGVNEHFYPFDWDWKTFRQFVELEFYSKSFVWVVTADECLTNAMNVSFENLKFETNSKQNAMTSGRKSLLILEVLRLQNLYKTQIWICPNLLRK